jgi:hypothetical protein
VIPNCWRDALSVQINGSESFRLMPNTHAA